MKRILFIALLGLVGSVGCGVQVDADTYKPVGHQYSRTDGWFVDSDNVMYYFVNGVKSGAKIDTSGNFTTTGTLTYTNLSVSGTLAAGGVSTLTGAVIAASTSTVVATTTGIDFSTFRIFDARSTFLTVAATDDDDLTYFEGTFGTAAATLETIDCGGLADTSQKAIFTVVVPNTLPTGATVTLVANVGMRTVVADQEATLDFSCYVADYANEDQTMSADLITTAAQSVNSATFADVTFTVDDASSGYVLTPGDVLECLVTALCDDDGNAGNDITIVVNRLDLKTST